MKLASGSYTFEITGGTTLGDRSNVNYRILDSTGVAVATVAGANLSAASVNIVGNAAANTGLTVAFGGGGVAVGDSIRFEYIKHGEGNTN